MIISGGFNVYPREVEDVLSQHPAVAAAAVVGIPDAKWGEAVHAQVVLRAGASVAAEELMALVRERKGAVHGAQVHRVRRRAAGHRVGQAGQEGDSRQVLAGAAAGGALIL